MSLRLLLAPALLALPARSVAAQPAPPAAAVAFERVTVIDVARGARRPDQTVVVRGDRIVAVGPAARTRVPAGATRVDGRGRFLIPGMWDMHAHTGAIADVQFPLHLANGVTGIRDLHLGTDDAARRAVALRDSVASGRRPGPRMVVGANLTGGDDARPTLIPALGPARGRAIVDSLAGIGVDLVKVLGLVDRATYFAVADQARRRGLPLDGHVPVGVSAAEAADAGQRTIEHVAEGNLLSGCTTADSALRAERAAAAAGPRGPARRERVVASFVAAARAHDATGCRALARRLARRGTAITPTLLVGRLGFAVGAAPALADSTRPYAPARGWAWWDAGRAAAATRDDAAMRALVDGEMRVAALMHREGVTVLVGTDMGTEGFPAAGFAFHEELGLLVRAGMTPAQALRAATLDAARVLRLPAGEVRPGRLADLVLLDADPTLDIANASRIRGVVAAGRWMDRAALDALLAGVRERVAALDREAGAVGR